MPRQRSTARAWILAFVPVVVIVGLMAWGYLALDSLGTPDLGATDDSTEIVVEPDTTPTPDSTAVPEVPNEPFLVDVEPIDDMPASGGFTPEVLLGQEMNGDPAVLSDVVYLGTRDEYFAQGLLSGGGKVCLWLHVTDIDATPGISGKGECATWADFVESGLSITTGTLELRWFADGTAEWIS